MPYSSKEVVNSSIESRLKFYNEVIEKGFATVLMRDRHTHAEMEIVCTATDSDERAMPQYQILGNGGLGKLVCDTGSLSVRWDKHFKGKLFTFKLVK